MFLIPLIRTRCIPMAATKGPLKASSKDHVCASLLVAQRLQLYLTVPVMRVMLIPVIGWMMRQYASVRLAMYHTEFSNVP